MPGLRSTIVLALIGLLAFAAGASAATPRCYGAASRDPLNPCFNPRLTLRVTPTPDDALLVPNAPCSRLPESGRVHPCGFGEEDGKVTVAVLGDSHASAWRAALRPLALARKWRGISITHTRCAFSRVISPDTEAAERDCKGWNDETITWFEDHPEVTTVFVVDAVIPSRTIKAKMNGFRRAWLALPHTVRHIIVVRDNPRMQVDTPPCIERALKRKVDPGVACARKRAASLRPDPAAEAVRRMHSKRIKLIDLSDFFCDATRCFPVVGGVLAYKDLTHITRAYAETLSPYILRAVRHLKIPV